MVPATKPPSRFLRFLFPSFFTGIVRKFVILFFGILISSFVSYKNYFDKRSFLFNFIPGLGFNSPSFVKNLHPWTSFFVRKTGREDILRAQLAVFKLSFPVEIPLLPRFFNFNPFTRVPTVSPSRYSLKEIFFLFSSSLLKTNTRYVLSLSGSLSESLVKGIPRSRAQLLEINPSITSL